MCEGKEKKKRICRIVKAGLWNFFGGMEEIFLQKYINVMLISGQADMRNPQVDLLSSFLPITEYF